MEDKAIKESIALIGIIGLTAIYMLMGNNGVVFTAVIGALTGVVGLAIGIKRSD